MKLYRVKNWNSFENNKSRERDHCRWVCLPNKQDSLAQIQILSQPDGIAIYGIWTLLLGALSQQRLPREGYLTEGGKPTDEPWTVEDLALRWRCDSQKLDRVFKFLCSSKVDYLECIDLSNNTQAAAAAATSDAGITSEAMPEGGAAPRVDAQDGSAYNCPGDAQQVPDARPTPTQAVPGKCLNDDRRVAPECPSSVRTVPENCPAGAPERKWNGKENTLSQKDESFNRFITIYPKAKSIPAARKEWAKIKGLEKQLPIIMRALEKNKNSEEWKRE